MIVAVALLASNLFRPPPVIDQNLLVTIAEQQGYVSPTAAEALRAQAARTQADLNELRRQSPDWAAEVDRAISAFNDSDVEAAREAFAEIDRLISERVEELRTEQARSKHAQATLLYPFQFSKSAPLLCDAADLAENNIWYWIECGRARMATDSLERAAAVFQTARDLAEASGNERDLAEVLVGMGRVRQAQGKLAVALEAYLDSLAIRRDLAARDPRSAGSARDVSVSLYRVGDARMAQGELTAALAAFEESLQIARDLASLEQGSAESARELSVSLNKVGDVREARGELRAALAAYEEGLKVARDLTSRDPRNAEWSRDVSVSWERIGDVRWAQGDLTGALAAHNERHAIAEKLAAADPGNAEWQRDLGISWIKIGDVREAQGDLPGALDAYAAAKAIAEKLAAADPGNAGWQRDLIGSHWRIADVAEKSGDASKAREHFQSALAITRSLEAAGRLAPVDGYFTEALEKRLVKLAD